MAAAADDGNAGAAVSAAGVGDALDEVSTANAAAAAGESGDADDGRVYLVPYKWWTAAAAAVSEVRSAVVRGVPYAASPAPGSSWGTKLMSIFNGDQVFHLKRVDDAVDVAADDEAASERWLALLASDLWSRACKWHSNSGGSNNGEKENLYAEDGSMEIFPLVLKISVIRETNVLVVKISKKENIGENCKRASRILSSDPELVHIWDFSGQTNLILMNEWNRLPQDCRSSDQEICLEVQVYGTVEVASGSDTKREELAPRQTRFPSWGSSIIGNGSSTDAEFSLSRGSFKAVGLGLTGLENLGNTCFMNSAVQCLAHTPQLVDYFLGDYKKEINKINPLGLKGELALAFGDLLRELWALDKTTVVPRHFKAKLSRFAPQFGGYSQHDSQELLAFLLDGLHEDLNRVIQKPYVEVKDADGRADEEVADEYWDNHLARNDSIIVATCQGQYKSTLVCPVCGKISVTFDPFMYLSLPLPSATTRTMTVTVLSTHGSIEQSPCTVTVPKGGDLKTLTEALSAACALRDDEMLLIAEVFNDRIIRYLEEPSDSLSLIRDGDQLVAYRLPKDSEGKLVVLFAHQHKEEKNVFGRTTEYWKPFGIPLAACVSDSVNGAVINRLYIEALRPFQRLKSDLEIPDKVDCSDSNLEEKSEMDAEKSQDSVSTDAITNEEQTTTEDAFQFYTADEKFVKQLSRIEMDQPVTSVSLKNRLHVLVSWHSKSSDQYVLSPTSSLPEVYKSGLFARKKVDTFSLYTCLEAFIKEEPLGPDDMWYCPRCKEHRQASKKLDLWRLPEILIIHLKRFSYSRFLNNKLETYVDFPIHDLDLAKYLNNEHRHLSNHYRLYAISNHYGNMGGGHYTAYVCHDSQNRWYDFDDRRVTAISKDSIKTSAAYVLFYRREKCDRSDSPATVGRATSHEEFADDPVTVGPAPGIQEVADDLTVGITAPAEEVADPLTVGIAAAAEEVADPAVVSNKINP